MALYWCDNCRSMIKSTEDLRQCSGKECAGRPQSMTTDIRPVFARERRILEYFLEQDLMEDSVWRSSRSQYYYINGESVPAPTMTELRHHLDDLRGHLLVSKDYDALDEDIERRYRKELALNKQHLGSLESEAMRFIQQVRRKFPEHICVVSFSGGKDSTIVSHLVRREIDVESVVHVFGNTTLEDPNTLAYVDRFQKDNPLVEFWSARSDKDFFQLVNEVGPPSRVMRWCCTIFKTGPINRLLQSFGSQHILTFYGIRASESQRRSQYDRVSEDSNGNVQVLQVDPNDDQHGVTVGAKIGQQITASPILEWDEFDVWLYILWYGLDFNDSYRWGFSRVGCWVCPMNSLWSENLTQLYFPHDTGKWHEQLVNFATQIGKPDPEEYVNDRAWTRRFGGAGMENRFAGLETRPCGESDDAIQITLTRPIAQEELLEFFKPLGTLNRNLSHPILGEFYFESRRGNTWSAIKLQAIENDRMLRATILNAENPDLITGYVRNQVIKYQTCIQCSACAAVCPRGAIIVSANPSIYEVDATQCIGCLECVTHWGATGCLVAKSLSVYGDSV